ncbi:hypothetical protein [Neolewinella persica]|uniref:hypothetical protein n=1 Tax=Neolewinella persica TaxID=70998 RepID=UPI0012FACCD0|nr:hypothetical protein [Neolewinella persica]
MDVTIDEPGRMKRPSISTTFFALLTIGCNAASLLIIRMVSPLMAMLLARGC